MTQQSIIDIGAASALLAMKIAAPALLTIMIAGLLISIFQAATQINEQTMSFIPKVIAMTAALFVTGPWILRSMMNFTMEMFSRIAQVTR